MNFCKDTLRITCNQIELLLQRHSADSSLPDMLFLHGFMGSGETFSKVIRELTTTVNALTLDIRAVGHAKASWRSEPIFTPEALSEALHKISTDLFFDQPFIYAYSMGGRLALSEASRHTPLFHHAPALLLESTTAGIEDAQERTRRRKDDRAKANNLLKDFDRFVQEWQHLPLFRAKSSESEHSVSEIQQTLSEYIDLQSRIEPNEAARWLLDFGTGSIPSLWSRLDRIAPPALLITGEHDHRFTQTARRMQQLMIDAKHITIPAASHRVHVDEPGKLALEIQRFINNLKPGSLRCPSTAVTTSQKPL